MIYFIHGHVLPHAQIQMRTNATLNITLYAHKLEDLYINAL